MKIGFVLDDTLDSTDGVQQHVKALGSELNKRGHEIHYLVGMTSKTSLKNVHSLSRNVVVRFNKNKLSTPLPAKKQIIRNLLTNENFDVLHIQMPYSPFLGGRVISLAKKQNIPTVGTFHIMPASKFELMGLKLLAAIQGKTFSSLSSIIAVSPPAKDCVENAFKRQSVVIPNPVDTSKYTSSNRKVSENKIVFVGRLVERKGCLQLLQALSVLQDSNDLDGVTVSICGDGSEKAKLEQFVKRHKLNDTVNFLGRVSEEKKLEELQSATIAVFPSTGGESFGIVLIEAMSAGAQTVLAGDNPGYRYVMDDREQQLVQVHDRHAFASQLKLYLNDANARKASFKWQKQRVEEFGLSKVCDQVEKVYLEAIANTAKG